MAVYSVILEDEKILEICSNYKNILLLGCGGCANESLAFSNHTPIYTIKNQDDKEKENVIDELKAIPYSVKIECERIKELLKVNGHFVKSILVPLSQNTLCIRHDGVKFNINPNCEFLPDVILTISCSAGAFGVSKDVGEAIPVYSIMQSCGQLAYYYEDSGTERKIIYEESKIMY